MEADIEDNLDGAPDPFGTTNQLTRTMNNPEDLDWTNVKNKEDVIEAQIEAFKASRQLGGLRS